MATPVKDKTMGRSLMGDELTMDEVIDGADFSPDELRDFLAADRVEVHADPRFKERLRERLWDKLKTRK